MVKTFDAWVKDKRHEFIVARDLKLRGFSVDECFGSLDDINETIEYYDKVIELYNEYKRFF